MNGTFYKDPLDNLYEEGCLLAKTIENGLPLEAEVLRHHKDGHRVPVLAHSSALQRVEYKRIRPTEARKPGGID